MPFPSEPPKVLVVEDQAAVRALVVRRVHHVSPDSIVIEASTGEEGIAIVDSQPLDLIISDHRLPGMDGVDFLLRARATAPDVPRVLLTGYVDADVATRAVNEGQVQAFFGKPALGEDFELRVKELIDTHVRERTDA